MGPWTGQAGEWLGVDLPIKPQRGQMVVLAAPDPDAALDIADPRVGISAFDTGGSILRKRLSDTLVAATKEDVGFDLTTTIEARDWLLERAAQLSDRVLDAQISGQTACLRPITPDGKPYVGAAPGWRNAYIAAGHASEGIHFAPVTAAAMSELIVTGQSSHDIGPLSPARLLDT
jgi:glycine oxidase